MWTLPNIITLVRICFTPVIALLPFIEGYWPKLIAFVIFLAAAISDIYDGHLARSRNEVTDLGKLLDPIADKLLLFATLDPDLLDLPPAARSVRHPHLGQHPAVGVPAADRPRGGHDGVSLVGQPAGRGHPGRPGRASSRPPSRTSSSAP